MPDGRVYDGEREFVMLRKGQNGAYLLGDESGPHLRNLAGTMTSRGFQGMLFAYKEWQMDWWIAHIREQRARADIKHYHRRPREKTRQLTRHKLDLLHFCNEALIW